MRRLQTLIYFCFFISQILFSQKFRTAEQYQKYFLENYRYLDDIEGIWQVNTSKYLDGDPFKGDEYVVCIIEENGEYHQYTLENGYFKPSKIDSKFTYNAYTYRYHRYNKEFLITTSAIANVYKNSISFELNMSKEMNYVLNNSSGITIIEKYYLQRLYPLESDIQEIKQNKKSLKSTGTGFAISSDGYIVTNFHVIENATKIRIKGVNGDYLKSYSAKLVVSNKNNDLALLKIGDPTFSNFGIIPYTLKSSISNVGEDIFVLGYPLTSTMGEEIKLTNGIISSKSGFQGDITSYQISAPIQPGNSGAPLFDKDGNIIGIINAKHTGAENAGYAIKSNYLFNLFDASPTKVQLPLINTLKGKNLSSQVQLANKYVFIIEVDYN